VIRELAIVGVGLLGGSVAKAARVGGLARRIIGVGRDAAGRPLAFVGSHPLAGSEQSGYRVARADLFRGATVVVTPAESDRKTAPTSPFFKPR